MKWPINWNPFRRSQALCMDDVLKRQSDLNKQVSSLRRELTMEDEVYSRDSEAKRLYDESEFNRIPH